MSARYPSAVATEADLKVAANRLTTVLRGSVSASDTVWTLADASRVVANMLLSVDSEIVSVDSVSSNNVTVTRGFDGTTAAAHSSGRTVSAFITAWHHDALVDEVVALETALGANLANVTAVAGLTPASTYDFSPQQPGGSLIVGANVITLSPVPLGINGANTNHYLYIYDGTGTAEAVLISGGTAVSGAASGTVIVTCANTHSGAWKIKSATAGIQEAWWAGGAAGVPIFVGAGSHNMYAPARLGARASLIGAGQGTTLLVRQATTGHVLHFAGGTDISVRDIAITTAVTAVSGAGIYLNDVEPMLDNVRVSGSYTGILIDACPRYLMSNLFIFDATISIHHLSGGGNISNVITSSGETNAISFLGVSGLVQLTNFDFQNAGAGSTGITLAPTVAGGGFGESVFTNGIIDGAAVASIRFLPESGANLFGIVFDSIECVGGAGGATARAISTANEASNIKFCNIQTRGCSAANIVEIIGGNLISLIDVTVSDATGTITNGIAIGVTTATLNFQVINCRVGYHSLTGLPNVLFERGLSIAAGCYGIVSGNMLYGSVAPFINLSTSVEMFVRGNRGVDDAVGTVASGTSITLPVNPTVDITGTTAIQTMLGHYALGSVVILTKVDAGSVALDTGGTNPSDFVAAATLTQNVPKVCVRVATGWLVL